MKDWISVTDFQSSEFASWSGQATMTRHWDLPRTILMDGFSVISMTKNGLQAMHCCSVLTKLPPEAQVNAGSHGQGKCFRSKIQYRIKVWVDWWTWQTEVTSVRCQWRCLPRNLWGIFLGPVVHCSATPSSLYHSRSIGTSRSTPRGSSHDAVQLSQFRFNFDFFMALLALETAFNIETCGLSLKL